MRRSQQGGCSDSCPGGQTPPEGGHRQSATERRVGDGRPSRPVPSRALPCPRARAVGTSQPAPRAPPPRGCTRGTAQHGPPWPWGQAPLPRDGYKTQGDSLHPSVRHLGDPGATSAQVEIPTALGAPGLAAAICGQVTPTPPNASPSPSATQTGQSQARRWASSKPPSSAGLLHRCKAVKARWQTLARKHHQESTTTAASLPTPAQGHAPRNGRGAFLPKLGCGGRGGEAPAAQGWLPGAHSGGQALQTTLRCTHYLPSRMLAARAHAAPAAATSALGTRGWPQAAGGASQPGARNILLQQGDPRCEDFACHVPATGEPRGPAPRHGPAAAALRPAPLRNAPQTPPTNGFSSLPPSPALCHGAPAKPHREFARAHGPSSALQLTSEVLPPSAVQAEAEPGSPRRCQRPHPSAGASRAPETWSRSASRRGAAGSPAWREPGGRLGTEP